MSSHALVEDLVPASPHPSPRCRQGARSLRCWGGAPVRSAHALRVPSGDLSRLPGRLRAFVEHGVRLYQPENVHVCDGSEAENGAILGLLEAEGIIKQLGKYENW